MNRLKQPPSRRALLIGAVALIAIFGALLALDLANHGLAWQAMWSLTGEEAPLAQLRGTVEWLGNLTREQPDTAPDVPIQHVGVNPYGVNTFLEQEVEPAKRERQVQMIADAGFHWIRQEIPWEDIEIAGRGNFIDTRNDPNGVDAWAKYDNIVDLVQQYGLEMQARIDKAPQWTHAQPDTLGFTPPDNWDDYLNFLTTFATRYKGRIHYYQIWNEPNIYPEWGNNPVSPEAYTQVLCRAYATLKAVDPNIVVISAALSPTISLTARDLNEFIFLQRMYDAGVKGCFDVMSTQGYGFFSGPTDQRTRPSTLTFARSLYLRDLMIANGDADKPIWISEAAWNPVDSPDVPPDILNKEGFGSVTQEQAARYMPLAYDRAQWDWSWVGVINYWFFKRADDADRDQNYYYFRMVEPDFTPLPVYDAMKQHIASETPTLYAGVHQADDWAIQHDPDAQPTSVPGAQFNMATPVSLVKFTYHGTGISVRWASSPGNEINVVIDSKEAIYQWNAATNPLQSADHWMESALKAPFDETLIAETHTVELSAPGGFLLDSVTVYDRTREHLTPVLTGGAVLGVLALFGIGWAVWKRLYR